MDILEECSLLGGSLLCVQKIEFTFYGIVSHLSHLPEVKEDKRFKKLTPEKFLRGSIDELKATLGQLENIAGKKLLLSSNEFKKFIKMRNLIIHNYWRLTKTKINGNTTLSDPEKLLKTFMQECDYWQKILNGLLYTLMKEAAKNENRINEINFTNIQKEDIGVYFDYIQKNFNT